MDYGTTTSASASLGEGAATPGTRGRAQAAYARMAVAREDYLQRARDCSELTMPTLFRSEGSSGSTQQIVPWNSIGAYLINNLAAKLVFALFPAGRPNFKAEQDSRATADLQQLPPEEQAHVKEVIDLGLSALEQEVSKAIEEDGDRARMFVAALRLIVGGNHGFQLYRDGTLRGLTLEKYACRRTPKGDLIEFAIEDPMDWDALDEDIRQSIMEHNPAAVPKAAQGANHPGSVTVYKHGRMEEDGKWHLYQEVCGIKVEDSEETYEPEFLPFMFMPWMLLDGEHYGRSYCEFYLGDLQSAESFTKAIGEGAAAIARFIILVSATGQTSKKALEQADNGAVITGREQDVSVLKSEKSGDFQIAQATLNDAIGRLGKAFLLQSAVQRKGERVTAEEIREVASELEDGLGGVYSQQIITWQTPYVKLKIAALQRAKRVPRLPKGVVKITVTAGLAALGRNAELAALRQFAAIVTEVFGQQMAATFFKAPGFMNRIAAALGVDPNGIIPSNEEFAQQAQAQQQQEMISQLGPEALRQVGSNVTGRQVAGINAEAKVATSPQQAPPPAA